MDTRKFYLLSSSIMSGFLFLVGFFIIIALNFNILGNGNNFLNSLLDPFKYDNAPVNILVLGGDRVNNNTDTMMLVNINPVTNKINVLSIPRDTRAQIKGLGTAKINAAYPSGGAPRAVETVSNLLGVKIKYFVFVDTSSFRDIIDILGGVDYDVPVNMDYEDPYQNLYLHLKKGKQHFNGAQAEQFMRFRQPSRYTNEVMKYYDGSDLKRIDAQQNFIREIFRQKANVFYLTKLKSIINVIFDNIETNLESDDALNLAYKASRVSQGNMQTFTLPGYSNGEATSWYYVCDKAKTNEIIKQNFYSTAGFVNTNVNNNAGGNKTKKQPVIYNNQQPVENNNTVEPTVVPDPNAAVTPDVTGNNPSNADTSLEPVEGAP